MCLSGGVAPCFQQPLVSQSRPVFVAPAEPSLRGTYTPLPTIDYSREAMKAFYPARTEPSVEYKILDILNNGHEPPLVLGSTLTARHLAPYNVPAALGSEVTLRSLGYGRKD